MFLSSSNNQRILCFHKSNCRYLCYFYHMYFTTLIDWLMFKDEEFDWLALFHKALSKILTACTDQLLDDLSLIKLFGMCETKRSSKCKRCLFIISKIDFIWSSQRPSSLIINFEQFIKSLLVWNIDFTFFLPVVDCTFLLSTKE